MDLSALLGGDAGGDIDALAQTTAGGDLLFKQPFGESTVWKTEKGGQVSVTVLFDPFLPWGKCNVLSSTAGDYIGDMKTRLGKFLVPDKMARTKPTKEEILWEKLRAHLPDRVFGKYLEREGKMDEYLDMIKQNVFEQVVEDEALIEAISTQEFLFTYHLAIDSYPQEKNGSKSSPSASANTERLGVLVFTIQGRLADDAPESMGKIGIDADEEVLATPGNTPPSTPAMQEEPTLRKHRNPGSKKAQKELEDLLQELDINADKLEKGHNAWMKMLPETSMEFFEQLGSWFSALMQRKQQQLSDAEQGRSSSMYR